MRENANESDKQAVEKSIQAAYQEATPEQRQQLDQFEQQLKQNNQLH